METALSAALVAAGVVLVAGAIVDLAWTALAAGSGGGPVTRRIGGRSWQVARAVSRRTDGRRPLAAAGVGVIATILLAWLGAILAGWALIFHGGDRAVVHAESGEPASVLDRLYFTGYTVFTLGNGELRPEGFPWQLATVLAAGTGLVMVTMSIAYLIPIASAVAERRQLASVLASMGDGGPEILVRSWTGDGFGLLGQRLAAVATQLELARQRHYAYPVLHYFHSAQRESAIGPNLVNLADAVLLLDHGVAPAFRPDIGVRGTLNDTIDAFLATLRPAYLDDTRAPVPPPSLASLAAAGIPVVPDEYERAGSARSHRRRLLAALLHDDGWDRR